MEPGGGLSDHLQRQGLQAGLFSDITVCYHSKEYRLHRIILCQSSYFRSLLSGPWKESGKPRVDLRIDDSNVTPHGLDAALSFLYGCPPALSAATVAAALAAACFLCIDSLSHICVKFMLHDLRHETFLAYHHLSHHHCYGRFAHGIRDACWSFLCAHAAKELLHLLPKLSLQYLCRLLKSDELWVVSELERYKLAKQVLLEWKIARIKASSGVSDGGGSSKKLRVIKSYSRRAARTSAIAAASNKNKNKGGKEKSKNKKDAAAAAAAAAEKLLQQRDDAAETPLRKLRRLWEEDGGGDETETVETVMELFTGGGIIFAYMDPSDSLQARKEFEDASIPADVINDGIWQNVLLKAQVLRDSDVTKSYSSSSSDSDDSSDDEDDDDDILGDDTDSDSSESEEEGWSSDRSSQEEEENNNNSNNNIDNEAAEGMKRGCLEMVSYNEEEAAEEGGGKRRRTSGGFSWSAKVEAGMQMSDFPPFRFGAEFSYVSKAWAEVEEKAVFYGGSRWRIVVSGTGKEEWSVAVECRPGSYCKSHAYEDWRKKVGYSARLYIRTNSGLQCARGSGQRCSKMGTATAGSKYHVGTTVTSKDVARDKPLRVVAVVQLE